MAVVVASNDTARYGGDHGNLTDNGQRLAGYSLLGPQHFFLGICNDLR